MKQRGYVGLTLSEAERRRTEGTLPPRSVVVTFDDGYASTLRAVPVLAELGFPGTVFIVTDFVASNRPLSWSGIDQYLTPDTSHELRPLTWEDAQGLVAAGWEIGSHTMTHPLLTKVEDERLRAELEGSRALIERHLGQCMSIAYPYGIADERVAAAAERAGYDVACTLTFAHTVDEPFRRPRIGIGPADTRIRFRLQASRLGQATRRSAPVRVARALRRRRAWLPSA